MSRMTKDETEVMQPQDFVDEPRETREQEQDQKEKHAAAVNAVRAEPDVVAATDKADGGPFRTLCGGYPCGKLSQKQSWEAQAPRSPWTLQVETPRHGVPSCLGLQRLRFAERIQHPHD